MVYRLRIEGSTFRDGNNREVTLHGINVAGDAKLPSQPNLPSHEPVHFFKGDDVSFIGRPFPLDEASLHFSRLARWGYNTIRYIFTWEAIEAAGPGRYDEEWIQYTISVLRVAKSYGFYVFMDPHQDVWSRFTGGSGAPMWSLYACGLNPEAFQLTEAALVQNTDPKPIDFPKMIWATNYTRLACQVLFTLFWAGKDFAPLAIIDGKNIQDYLQDHFIDACRHLALRIHEAGDLDHTVVIGWESINEPNRGLVGLEDITRVPSEQKLQKGTSPTAWQAILTGSGRPCEIEVWDVGGMGPYKSGSKLVDPQGQTAWLPATYDDSRYEWKRSAKWKLGECIWAQHGVWDPASDTLLKKDYFSKNPRNGDKMDYEYFTNLWFMEHYRKYRDAIRSVFPETVMFCQAPVLELPPTIANTSDDDPNMVYTPHYYDGLTLMNKKWNRYWNVDVFGIMRGRYSSPAFALKIGETAIRNCFRDTLIAMRKEGRDNMGMHPCMIGEIGIPYDMENGKAYKTGDYSSQILAMDANHFALEAGVHNYTWWTYTASNTHFWGDQWNGEDLSIYSKEDPTPPLDYNSTTNASSSSIDMSSTPDSPTSPASSAPLLHSNTSPKPSTKTDKSTNPDYRAAAAFIRPYPIATHGARTSFTFALRSASFTFTLTATSPTPESAPTEIFLPEFHFPRSSVQVHVTDGGRWEVSRREVGGGGGGAVEHDRAEIQILRWWHGAGSQKIEVKGVVRGKNGVVVEAGGWTLAGMLDWCCQRGCVVM